MWQCGLGQVKVGENIRPVSILQLLVADIHDALLRKLNSLIKDHSIYFAVALQRPVNNFSGKFRLAKVPFYQKTTSSVAFYHSLGIHCIFSLVQIYYGYVCTFFSEPDSNCAADAAVASGNNSYFSGKLAASLILWVVRDRDRVHFILQSWLQILIHLASEMQQRPTLGRN
ncbi:hypothetical protein D3C78_995570 [compost metagenome]